MCYMYIEYLHADTMLLCNVYSVVSIRLVLKLKYSDIDPIF